MEPIAAAAAGAVIRPAAAVIHSELSAVLRDGRVLAGEVLQNAGDGNVLLALGRHQVPAESRLRLDPGQQFLFRVEHQGEEIVLRLLGTGDPSVDQLLTALRGVVGEERPIGELLTDLAHRLRAELARPDGPRPGLQELAEALPRHVGQAAAEGGGQALQEILMRSGLRYEASLAAALKSGVSTGVLAALQADLKSELMRAFGQLEDGPLREALARALAGIEAEQLLNLARQRAGEPLVWSFPFPDAGGWTTARLLVPGREDGESEEAGDGADARVPDLVLGVRFTELGPIRAELSIDRDRLSVRVLVTKPELVGLLQEHYGPLAERLGGGQRSVHLFARLATADEVDVADSPLDIRFLREHRLMDVSG